LLNRGLEFPKNIRRAAGIVSRERREIVEQRPRIYH